MKLSATKGEHLFLHIYTQLVRIEMNYKQQQQQKTDKDCDLS